MDKKEAKQTLTENGICWRHGLPLFDYALGTTAYRGCTKCRDEEDAERKDKIQQARKVLGLEG